MSKKPVPSKKQAVSSSRSRHGAYVRRMRTNMENKVQLMDCANCGVKKRMHFACEACGNYRGKEVVTPKSSQSVIREIEA